MILETAAGNLKNLKPGVLLKTRWDTPFFLWPLTGALEDDNRLSPYSSERVKKPAGTVLMFLKLKHIPAAIRGYTGTYHFWLLSEDKVLFFSATHFGQIRYNEELEAIALLNDLFRYAK